MMNSLGIIEIFIILLICVMGLAVIGGIVFFIVSQTRSKQRDSAAVTARCPHCGKDVTAGMQFCPHCGGSLTPPVSPG